MLLLGVALMLGQVLERWKADWLSEAGGALLIGSALGFCVMLANNLDDSFSQLFRFNVRRRPRPPRAMPSRAACPGAVSYRLGCRATGRTTPLATKGAALMHRRRPPCFLRCCRSSTLRLPSRCRVPALAPTCLVGCCTAGVLLLHRAAAAHHLRRRLQPRRRAVRPLHAPPPRYRTYCVTEWRSGTLRHSVTPTSTRGRHVASVWCSPGMRCVGSAPAVTRWALCAASRATSAPSARSPSRARRSRRSSSRSSCGSRASRASHSGSRFTTLPCLAR